MNPSPRPLAYTETEIRSYLPTGWSLPADGRRGWDGRSGEWSIEVLDGADNRWTVAVDPAAADKAGRLEALRDGFLSVWRKALGRKSVLTG